jgi:hypothetical protein
VLVVCPVSLKAEWEEQIVRFTARAVCSVFGPRAARLAAYREPTFFNTINYEQVLSDAADINEIHVKRTTSNCPRHGSSTTASAANGGG